MDNLVGQSLGQYQVQEVIGIGGMAQVYKAYQRSLDRHVAIKAISLQANSARDPHFAERFTAEARLVAKLSHPNIVTVHDYGEEQGWAYLVMEYIAGGTLRDRMVRAEQQQRRLELALSLELLAQAALALENAHLNGIVHRDVKPANMLLRTEDQLLLTDFGIAAILEASAYAGGNGPAGTPQYMAPEQGLPNGIIDARTDIYALGVVLFQAATGRLPFDGDAPTAIIARQINEMPPRPSQLVPGLPPRVEQIILRAMEKSQVRRYQSAREMADALRGAAYEAQRATAQAAQMHGQGQGQAGQPTVRANGHQPQVAVLPLPIMGVPGQPGTCFRCGAANNPQNRFCTACGYDLSGSRAQADRYLVNGRPLRCRISLRNGVTAGRWFVLHQDVTSIGRIADNDVVIPDGTVSRNHARLSFRKGLWCIEDLKSSNGTFVNGRRLAAEPVGLKHSDEVRFGDDYALFELLV